MKHLPRLEQNGLLLFTRQPPASPPPTYTLSVNNIYYRYHHTPDLYNVIELGEKLMEKDENKNGIDKIVTKRNVIVSKIGRLKLFYIVLTAIGCIHLDFWINFRSVLPISEYALLF